MRNENSFTSQRKIHRDEMFEESISKLKGSCGERDHKRPEKVDVEVSRFLLLLAMTA